MLVVPAAALASEHPGEECMSKLTQSYVHGVSMTPLIGETIGVHFDKVAARFADRDALIVRQQNIRWTYGELKEKTDALAAGLLALGLSPGDRVGIWSPNNAEWVVTQFATAKAGLILVNINPAYRLSELEYALNKVGCRALVTATRFKTSDYIGMVNTLAPELAGRLQFDDPINIQFTSGTTGAPKGATLSHHNILNNGFFLGEAMHYTDQDKACIP